MIFGDWSNLRAQRLCGLFAICLPGERLDRDAFKRVCRPMLHRRHLLTDGSTVTMVLSSAERAVEVSNCPNGRAWAGYALAVG